MYTIDHSYSGPLFRNGYILGMRTPKPSLKWRRLVGRTHPSGRSCRFCHWFKHIAALIRVPRRMIQWQNMLVLVVKTYMKYRSIRKIKQIDIGGSKKCGFRVWGCICCQRTRKSSTILTQRLLVHSESCKLLDTEM